MEHRVVIEIIHLIADGLEGLSVAVISIAFFHAIVRSLLHVRERKAGAFVDLKSYIGKALQLGLEFLIAADIIRTVIIEPTREGFLLLGLLVGLRTFLSWSITVEIDGCWPWDVAKTKNE